MRRTVTCTSAEGPEAKGTACSSEMPARVLRVLCIWTLAVCRVCGWVTAGSVATCVAHKFSCHICTRVARTTQNRQHLCSCPGPPRLGERSSGVAHDGALGRGRCRMVAALARGFRRGVLAVKVSCRCCTACCSTPRHALSSVDTRYPTLHRPQTRTQRMARRASVGGRPGARADT